MMKKTVITFLGLLALSNFLPVTTVAGAIPATQSNSLAPMLKQVMPSVVNIQVEAEMSLPEALLRDMLQNQAPLPPGQDNPLVKRYAKMGSGVIVDAKKGWIITNAHVVSDAKKIVVRLNDKTTQVARLVGSDKESDIAVLQIKTDHLQAIKLGDSNHLEVGDYVVAIGNPFGLNQTVTSGIVSALQRNDLRIEGYENFIQTDAPINPGNSGGALVNLAGELIGINTAILSSTGGNVGIGFAIPVNMAKNIMQQIVEYGSVKRGILGLYVQGLTPKLAEAMDLKKESGVVITTISPGSAAEKAGLKVGDVITQVNDQPVADPFQLRNVVGLIRPGNPVKFVVLRSGKLLTLNGFVGDPDKPFSSPENKKNDFLSGVVLSEVRQTTSDQASIEGVQIVNLEPDSFAAKAGLIPGDIITSVELLPIKSIAELKKQVAKVAELKKPLLLSIQRGNGVLLIVIDLENPNAESGE